MKVRATTTLAGLKFLIKEGDVLDESAFRAKVGDGWRALCVPVDAPTIERAVKPSARERRSGR